MTGKEIKENQFGIYFRKKRKGKKRKKEKKTINGKKHKRGKLVDDLISNQTLSLQSTAFNNLFV